MAKHALLSFVEMMHNNCDLIIFDDHRVHRVAEVQFLGVFIDECLNWKVHILSMSIIDLLTELKC